MTLKEELIQKQIKCMKTYSPDSRIIRGIVKKYRHDKSKVLSKLIEYEERLKIGDDDRWEKARRKRMINNFGFKPSDLDWNKEDDEIDAIFKGEVLA
jgi:hypothetical protein